MTKQNKSQYAKGFTIIELMVSMTIFTVLITAGMGAILQAMQQHKAAENMRTAMDNLNFVMEDMARNVRLGSNFHCQTGAEPTYLSGSTVAPQNCFGTSNQLVFNALDGTPISYTITRPDVTPANQIVKQTNTASATPYSENLTPANIQMDYFRSGFTVRGAESGDGQPSIVIRLAGTVSYEKVVSLFAIETTVSPRSLDANN